MNRKRRDFWVAFAVMGAAFSALAAHTWRKWPDFLVDSGLQLYCPWKLSTGSVLYRDVAYLSGGPLSQYYHTLLFKIFGVSFLTLILSNLVIAVVLILVLYCCFYQSSSQLTAVTVGLAIVAVFVFAQHTPRGIFNYITPYCTDVVHGLVLSVFAIALLAKWFREEKLWLAAGSGFSCGLAFLTKPEVCVALGISIMAGIALFWRVKQKPGFLLRSLAMMAGTTLVPLAAFFVYFWRVTDLRGACRGMCGGWVPLFMTHTADNPYFRWCMGLDAPAVHLQRMFLQFFGLVVIVAAAGFICRRSMHWSLPIFAAVGLAALAAEFNWVDCGQCLPLVCLALLALQFWRAKVSGLETGAVFPLLWTLFSLGLLLKLGLFSRIWHYGFVLGMPAFLSAIYLLLWLLPRELERFNVHPNFLRGALWLLLMVGFAELLSHSMIPYSWKTVPAGSGPDKMWVYNPQFRPDDAVLVTALSWMETNAPPQATLSVLPTGLMLNYLSRRTNPTHYPIWPPPEVAAFGQQNMTDDFIQNSPDYIMLVGVDYGEFGVKYFGVEESFGGDLMKWIGAHYEQKCLIGEDWLQTGRFGVKILQKTVR